MKKHYILGHVHFICYMIAISKGTASFVKRNAYSFLQSLQEDSDLTFEIKL